MSTQDSESVPTTARACSIAVVGCYTTEQRKARGMGIGVFRYTDAVRWESLGRLDGIVNPSYVHADPARNIVYAAHGESDFASAYAVDPDSGAIVPLGQVYSAGLNGVAVAVHPSARFLFVANYSSGSVATLPINPDGSLSAATHSLDLPGPTGPHKVEQSMSHPHDVVMDPSGRFRTRRSGRGWVAWCPAVDVLVARLSEDTLDFVRRHTRLCLQSTRVSRSWMVYACGPRGNE